MSHLQVLNVGLRTTLSDRDYIINKSDLHFMDDYTQCVIHQNIALSSSTVRFCNCGSIWKWYNTCLWAHERSIFDNN